MSDSSGTGIGPIELPFERSIWFGNSLSLILYGQFLPLFTDRLKGVLTNLSSHLRRRMYPLFLLLLSHLEATTCTTTTPKVLHHLWRCSSHPPLIRYGLRCSHRADDVDRAQRLSRRPFHLFRRPYHHLVQHTRQRSRFRRQLFGRCIVGA